MEPRARICFDDAFKDLTTSTEVVRAILSMLNRGEGAREAALCLTKLQKAEHWLEDSAQLSGYNDKETSNEEE